MFSFRLCRESDKDCWITLNRMFMEEEIQDHDLWNDTNKVSDEQFSNTFLRPYRQRSSSASSFLKKTIHRSVSRIS